MLDGPLHYGSPLTIAPQVCALCHEPGGWTFRDYGDGVAHSDCIERVGADERPTLEMLQRAEREMQGVGYCFRDSCGYMAGESYHQDHVRRYHIWGYDYNFASWSSFQRWLQDAYAYLDHCANDWDEDDTDSDYD